MYHHRNILKMLEKSFLCLSLSLLSVGTSKSVEIYSAAAPLFTFLINPSPSPLCPRHNTYILIDEPDPLWDLGGPSQILEPCSSDKSSSVSLRPPTSLLFQSDQECSRMFSESRPKLAATPFPLSLFLCSAANSSNEVELMMMTWATWDFIKERKN